MCVIDTSIWIELAVNSAVGAKARPLFPSCDGTIVPTIVQYELCRWFLRRVDEAAMEAMMARTSLCDVIRLDTHLAVAASGIARDCKLAMADAIVYATALTHHADLLTCDARFEGLERVIYLAKDAA